LLPNFMSSLYFSIKQKCYERLKPANLFWKQPYIMKKQ
jgi:hypothetical protein